jgi:hypothetical protein
LAEFDAVEVQVFFRRYQCRLKLTQRHVDALVLGPGLDQQQPGRFVEVRPDEVVLAKAVAPVVVVGLHAERLHVGAEVHAWA